MTTFTDGAPPSVTPEPDDGSVPHRAEAPDQDPDTGSAWLHDEIQRRIAEGAAAGGGGRHARHGEPTSPSSAEYIARHSVATPGPGAPRPRPVGGQMSQASELLRRERTEGTTVQPVWSGPPTRPDEGGPDAAPPDAAPPAAGPADQQAGGGPVRPGIAAAAAMRGAARGRARAAAAAATAPVAAVRPVDGAPPPRGPAAPAGAPQDPSATAPVETAPVETAPVETTPVETTPVETTPVEAAPADTAPADASPDTAAPGTAPVGPGPASAPPAGAAPSVAAAPDPAMPDSAAPDPAALDCAAPGSAAAPDADVRPPASPRSRPAGAPPRTPAPDPTATEHTAPVPAVEDHPGPPERVDSPPRGISVPAQRASGQRGGRRPGAESPEDQASRRVRVVLAERKGVARPVRTVITIQESSGVGELLRTNLIGSQLAIALRFAIGAGLTLGLLPLLFAMVPEIGRVEVLGIRLPWLLLGVLVYPFLFGLGLWHTRTAEHLEQNFAETVQD
ncbi:hypothetical protein [Pseudonocardia adelaidensis]|uniref:Uncharacterized protein n=1 Tax=Pseudonocardia adelaidensis TaxID=648754 RepID=A0ABP9NTK5_9PSEU